MKSLLGCLLVYAVVAWVFATHGRPNIDEGIFLGAAGLVGEGKLPYRDFPFSQAPLLPYAYALAPAWDGSLLLGGRLVSWVLACTGMAAALWIALRVAGTLAGIGTLLFALGTLPLLWVSNTVRAQSVGTPLLLLSVAALTFPARGALGAALAPSLALWSCGFRLTNGLAFAVVAGLVAWSLRADAARLGRVALLVAAQLPLVFAPALRAPSAAFFHLITAQLERGERIGYVGEVSALAHVARTLGLYRDLAVDAWPLLLGVAIAAFYCVREFRRGTRFEPSAPLGDPQSACLTLSAIGLASLAPHLLFANAFPEYLVSLWALWLPVAGIGLARLVQTPAPGAARWGLVLAVAAAGVAHVATTWNVWIGSGDASIASFRRVAGELAQSHARECQSITFATHLALEARCPVMPGLEYSLFSYFPDLPLEEARQRGVLSREWLQERVEARRPDWIALAPGHARMLAGARVRVEGGRLRVPQVAPLAFLGERARDYRFLRTLEIPSGIHRPGERETLPLHLFERTRK